jgi:type IV pilus assembly protein PilA
VILDYFLIIVGFAVVSSVLDAGEGADNSGLAALSGLAMAWLYKAGMECSPKQGTLGKLALGVKVVSLDGERISFGRASGRFFAFLLSGVTFYIGFLIAAFSKRRQALHDMIAGTLVVRSKVRRDDVILAGPVGTEGVAAAVVSVIGGIALIGMLAAIAIPAYQDYTLRAQVSEGLNLAAATKAAVAETFLNRGAVPVNRTQAGMSPSPTDSHGKYVTSIAIVKGRVDITYGNEANTALAGRVLSITPYIVRDGANGSSVVWRCGFAEVPINATQLTEYVPGAIEAKYLPSACRL